MLSRGLFRKRFPVAAVSFFVVVSASHNPTSLLKYFLHPRYLTRLFASNPRQLLDIFPSFSNSFLVFKNYS